MLQIFVKKINSDVMMEVALMNLKDVMAERNVLMVKTRAIAVSVICFIVSRLI